MRRVLASASVVALAIACAAADMHYVVLTIDDPDGWAAAADQLLLTDDAGLSRTFERGDRPFPLTVTLSSESAAARAVSVWALQAGESIALCSVTIDFQRQDGGRSRCELTAPDTCADSGTCPPCTGDHCPPPVPPRLTAISQPQSVVTDNTVVAVTLSGVGFASTARAIVDGVELGTENNLSLQPTELKVNVPVDPNVAGYIPLQAANETAGAPSNTAWMRVVTSSGFIVEELNPDYGVPGETITMFGAGYGANVVLADAASHATLCTAGNAGGWIGPNGTSPVSCVLQDDWSEGLLIALTDAGYARTRLFTVGSNLSRLLGNVVTASSVYPGNSYPVDAIADGDLGTSWYAFSETCAATEPCAWVEIVLSTPVSVRRIGIRGLRDVYAEAGYDILVARVDLFDGSDTTPIATRSVWTDRPYGDANVDFATPVDNVDRVRLTSLVAETAWPGLGELEIFGVPAL